MRRPRRTTMEEAPQLRRRPPRTIMEEATTGEAITEESTTADDAKIEVSLS